MYFKEIVNRLNVLAKEKNFEIATLQELKRDLKGLSHPRTYKIFTMATTFLKGDGTEKGTILFLLKK